MAGHSAPFPTLAVLGAGNMAGAIVRGAVAGGTLDPARVSVFDTAGDKMEQLAAETGIQPSPAADACIARAEAVLLAVKPQNMGELLASIQAAVRPGQLFISIAAGIRAATLAAGLSPEARIVRVMPNTPALVGVGAAGVAAGPGATGDDVGLVVRLFRSIGIAERVTEDQLDAVTALSGSGPAYVFRMMEIMAQTGAAMGLDAESARRLTLQTVLGAARLAIDSAEPLEELRRRVTSPGGTTAAALEVFAAAGFERALAAGIMRARERSMELAG